MRALHRVIVHPEPLEFTVHPSGEPHYLAVGRRRGFETADVRLPSSWIDLTQQIECLVSGLFEAVKAIQDNFLARPSGVMNEDRSLAGQHIVRVLAGRASPAFSLVSEFRPVRGCAWKCRAVRPCCRRRCRQTAARVRAVEWALAGVLPGLGSGMVRGPYAGPATRAGCAPARNLYEWPPGLARRGSRPGEVGKAHGADRPHLRAFAPANSPPSPRPRPGVRSGGASGLLRASGGPLHVSARPGR